MKIQFTENSWISIFFFFKKVNYADSKKGCKQGMPRSSKVADSEHNMLIVSKVHQEEQGRLIVSMLIVSKVC